MGRVMATVPIPGTIPSARATEWLRARPVVGLEMLALLASLFFTVFCNFEFWHGLTADLHAHWRLLASLFVVVTALQAFLLGLVLTRRTAKPVLAVLFVATAFAAYYMSTYKVYMDPDMVRNVLNTDPREAGELLVPGLVVPLLGLAALPLVALWRLRVRKREWKRALWLRLAFLAGMLALCAVAAMFSFKDLSALVRNQREIRYLVTPANYVVSLSRVLLASPPGPRKALIPIGEDAKQAPRGAGAKPRLLVFVLGETARAQNWGLDGYARQTTPELAAMPDVINFPDASACGTSTEVSVPCLFSPYGRHAYDEGRIRSHQSLLHVLQRAGVETLWRDNQSGCKHVCDGLPFESLADAKDPALCDSQRCFDGILLSRLKEQIMPDGRDRVVVLHQLGNHGPGYYQRYPAQFRRFVPTCDTDEIGNCSQQQIVNSYDNALLYTDHVLARAIDLLRQEPDYDTALLYVSDHGESLGENGLFLHGVPYAIAPSQQTHVPMLMWFSPDFAKSQQVDLACVRRQAALPASHDNLFPTILGLMQVGTGVYDRGRDLLAHCRTDRG
jgi:lipid A ethanolaminephosphotransferase